MSIDAAPVEWLVVEAFGPHLRECLIHRTVSTHNSLVNSIIDMKEHHIRRITMTEEIVLRLEGRLEAGVVL